MKHTPGPYSVVDRRAATLRNVAIFAADGKEIAEMSRVMQTPTYGPAFDLEDVRATDKQALVDAALLAAAPDLLSALEDLKLSAEVIPLKHLGGRVREELFLERMDAARAAIARAKGEV